jgi:uncharacterized membrane protein
LIYLSSSPNKIRKTRKNTMNNTFRFVFVAASVLALTSPVLAQSPMKGERTHQRSGYSQHQGQVTAPVAMRGDAAYQTFDSMAPFGADRASSPYAGGGY